MILKYSLYYFFVLSLSSFAIDRATIVKAVGDNGNTFITDAGKKDGVIEGMDVLFSGQGLAFKARAITVTRAFTQWRMLAERMPIPYSKDQVVNFSTNPDILDITE